MQATPAYVSLLGVIGLVVAGVGARPALRRGAVAAAVPLALLARAHAGWFASEELFWRRTAEKKPRAWVARLVPCFVILSAAKNPFGHSPPTPRRGSPAGFFAALRMTV